jgi:hypothetical protein
VSRRLILLDLALLAVLGLLGFQMRREWAWAHARERAFLRATISPKPVSPLRPLPKVAPVSAATYAETAQMNLFSKDRNPTVIVEQVVQKPKPVPPFPVARGVMLWGNLPPTVVLSEKVGGPQKGYHAGDTIGEWSIVSVDNQFVVLEWDGQEFKKRLDELMDNTPVVVAGNQTPAAPQPAPKAQNLGESNKGPGVDVGGGYRGCAAGDTTPPGAVQDGYKKVVSATPFGNACRWEAVK